MKTSNRAIHVNPTMKIQHLLNPFCTDHDGYRSSESPTPGFMPRSVAPNTSVPKRQKIPKDAAIFSKGNKTVGFVNYPPHEAGDNKALAAQHLKFRLYPERDISSEGVRHIPYNSDKKDFMEKTNRVAFEVFHYRFKLPGEEKEYVVAWDYNVGLVRITPFFKSLKYSKTIPAKALRENPGLKDISFSITGGALVCQGYWVPFLAAKAIAATFCYKIRFALTPIFGNDFPAMCLPPNDPNHANFTIDPEIIRECAEETERFRVEGAGYQVASQWQSSGPHTPKPRFENPFCTKAKRASALDEESGYGTESPQSEYLFSPQVSPRSTTWTSVNRSESPASPSIFDSPTFGSANKSLPPLHQVIPTSVPNRLYDNPIRTKRTYSKVACGIDETNDAASHIATAAELDSHSDMWSDNGGDGMRTEKEIEAAEILLQLSAVDEKLPLMKRTRRGSAY